MLDNFKARVWLNLASAEISAFIIISAAAM
jgi:hypothetical protein